MTLSVLDPLELVDVSDGDTSKLRMPVRMLSVDTPEVTARTDQRAQAIDQAFALLAEWIEQDRALISRPLASSCCPSSPPGVPGHQQLQQGRDTSSFAKQRFQERLTRSDGSQRKLFVRIADSSFDANGRLLAYEYRAMEELFRVTRKIVNNQPLKPGEPGRGESALLRGHAHPQPARPRGLTSASPRSTGCGSGPLT